MQILMTKCIHLLLLLLTHALPAAHPGHGKHAGAEATADGSGHIDENSRLLLHCYLLRGTFQRGTHQSAPERFATI